MDGEEDTLHVARPALPLVGEWTLGSLCDRLYEQVITAFPDALLEDGHDVPEIATLLEPEAGRISYDAPIHSVRDIDATPLTPRALNLKPCRVGDLRSLFDVYSACEGRGLLTYGGGMGELDVGRGQIQLLASLFHPDGPNDVAPSGFNVDRPAADLPSSPLAANPAPTGFRRVCTRATTAKRSSAAWGSPRSSGVWRRSLTPLLGIERMAGPRSRVRAGRPDPRAV